VTIVPVVLVHGGAGDLPEAARPMHAAGCQRAAEAGLAKLLETGSAIEGAIAAVRVLEDDARFNAGTGACLTSAGTLELDASIMEGAKLRAGAVAAISPFQNPIEIARAVMDDGRHVLYAAHGATDFAREMGFTPANPLDMITPASRARLAQFLAGSAPGGWAGGTVGAVACDREGHVVAATSTGGMVGKRPGRVGDSPILGAGTYADDEAGAASATGDGEAALRLGLTRFAIERMRTGSAAQLAAEEAIAAFGTRVSGKGGIILVSRTGEIGFAKNTTTMSYGLAREGEPARSGF
jgi:beta-aspartyl-peptidase (threonine type)